MAESMLRIQRWDNGVLVEDYTVPKAPERYNAEVVAEDLSAALPILAALIGDGTDPASTDTLQGIKNTSNATINASPAPYIKALADALITLARNQRKQIRAEMRAFDAAD
jgi:hypothetical protein